MSSFDMDIQQISLHDSETSYTVGRRVQLQWWLYINWFHTVLRFQHPKDWRLVEATNDNNLCLQSLEGQEKVMTSRQGYEGKGRNYLVKSKNIRVYMEKKRNVQLQEGNASPRKQTPRVLRTRDANTQPSQHLGFKGRCQVQETRERGNQGLRWIRTGLGLGQVQGLGISPPRTKVTRLLQLGHPQRNVKKGISILLKALGERGGQGEQDGEVGEGRRGRKLVDLAKGLRLLMAFVVIGGSLGWPFG